MSSSKQQLPSVLVTDSRERPGQRRRPLRQQASPGSSARAPMRSMTVDNVLQHNSQIPSGQPRGPPMSSQRSQLAAATTLLPNRRTPFASGLVNLPPRTGPSMPSRTTKISEKLVLLPETDRREDDEADEAVDPLAALPGRAQDEEARPMRDEELDVLRKRGGIRGKSYAERLPKPQRRDKISRLTAYCIAQAFNMVELSNFLRDKHEVKTKLYDDCLYVIYALPLLNGTDGYRVRGRPMLKTPGTGKTMLELEMERSEQGDHHGGYFDDDAYATPESPERDSRLASSPQSHHYPEVEVVVGGGGGGGGGGGAAAEEALHSQMGRLAPDAKNFAEMLVFSYGVVVFWNFSEHQEKDILADLTFAGLEEGIKLLTRPLEQDDFETEEFHFEYSAEVKRPRVFNDMITLLPRSDHMIKLTISHAIAQSTKLCFFEERMSETMLDAQHVPKRLALTGELNMTRTEIVKILGRLFKSRVEINLSSNILDVPNFFWDSEPTLHPLYQAVREYLEIDPRIKVLNERCRVFLDLAEILSDSVADAKMSAITWIIIVLILVSILVTVTEVALRFGMLRHSSSSSSSSSSASQSPASLLSDPSSPPGPRAGLDPVLARMLGLGANASLDDMARVIGHLSAAAAAAAASSR